MKVNDEKFLKFLYETTFEILKSYGSKGWTMDSVCKNAGISKDTLYRAVSSKEELILKALNFEINLHILRMEKIIDSNVEYYVAFKELIEILYQTLQKFSSKQLQSVLEDYPLSSQHTIKEFEKLISLIETFLEKGMRRKFLRSGLNTAFLAKNIHYTILYIIEKEDPKDYEGYIRDYFNILLNGMKGEKEIN